MITFDDVKMQEEALQKSEKKLYFIAVSSRCNQKLPYDGSNKSYAFWYDDEEIAQLKMGTRNYHSISYMRYI